jgi:hypothetical protein
VLKTLYIAFFLTLALGFVISVKAQKLTLSLPYNSDKSMLQDFILESGDYEQLHLLIKSYDVTGVRDSVLVYSYADSIQPKKQNGLLVAKLKHKQSDQQNAFNKRYKDILQKNNTLPAGAYHTYLTLIAGKDTMNQLLIQQVDSNLDNHSSSRDELNAIYNPSNGKKILGISLDQSKTTAGLNKAANTVRNATKKVEKTLNKKGFDVSYREGTSTTYVDLFYQSRFVGYYKVDLATSLPNTIRQQKEKLENNITGAVKSELESSKTVFAQFKELYEESKKKEVTGNLSLSGNVASGQEENSQNENNYYEIAGQVEIPVMNIPVSLEGYYTSQDKNRIAKASYLRIHYDTEKAKAELLKLIAGYRGKYDEAVSKGKGLEGVYNTYLNQLQSEKAKMLNELKAETGVSDATQFKLDTAGVLRQLTTTYEQKLRDTLTQASDSITSGNKTLAKATKTKDTVTQLYNKALRKYEQIQELETRIRKYYTLLEQYRNNNYFDSVLAYDKIKNISDGTSDEKTYKELAKSASNLLPEGTAKKFITGLTNLDAGIINKQVSSYTLNGQTLKGIDLGYDLGFCETGFTYGRVEYVTRDGQVDKYNGYSGRASFKPAKGQKATLVYYGYMPSRKMLNEGDFFKDVNVNMPTFKDPIHIVSALYNGTIARNINIEAEGATSFRSTKEFQTDEVTATDKISYKIAADGSIPQTTVNVKAGMEHVGKQFENNSLPMNMSGTDRYTAGATGQFFKNFLTLGVEYNYLIQQNFASRSAHSKWGFDIKTTSKRYPSASLSYKPFTTFRSFTDTLSIPQRPILGEVWLGKLSYQIKKKTYTLRLTALYNRNTALADTTSSNSNITQLNAIYTRNKLHLMLNLGRAETKADQLTIVHGKTNFLGLSAGYTLNPQWNLSIGQDLGTAAFGLSRYATNLSCGYRFKRTPLAIRAAFRYNTYKMIETQAWKKIYAGTLDMSWDFRFKMKDKT